MGDYHDTPRYRESVARLMAPGSVAIVGASPNGFGGAAVENFRRLGFTGPVVGVNPKYDEVLGFPCVPSLDEVPFVPDAVLLAVAAPRVGAALEAAAATGARGAVSFAYGFADVGEEGRAMQRRLTEVAAGAGMALIGPNCQGIINFSAGLALYMDSVHPYKPGRVGLIAESGSVLTALLNNERGVRWAHAVSSGNEAVTDAADILAWSVDQPEVEVVCAYLEAIRRPEAFFATAERARALGKQVVVCPAGRTAAAQAAATAHTGALAVPHRLVAAGLRSSGVTVVESLDELLATAVAMQSPRRPAGPRVAVLTASGGQIELVLDNLPGTGLEMAELSAVTVKALEEVLPPFLAARNPLDWWGVADAETSLPAMMRAIADDEGVDIVVQVGDFTVGPTGDRSRAAGAMAYAREVAGECEELMVVVDAVGGAPPAEEVERGLSDGVLVVSGMADGLRAIGHLVAATSPLPPRRAAGPSGPATLPWAAEPRILAGAGALDVLEGSGFPVVRRSSAATADEAVAAADAIGYPVVVKIADDGVAHKTEMGGVVLGVRSAMEARAVAADLLARVGGPLLVQEQLQGGRELILGLESRPELGAFLVVGVGGVWTELVDDVQIRPVGLRGGEAEAMLRGLRAFPLLRGARGGEPVALGPLVAVIESLDDFALRHGPLLASVDLNPVIALPDRAVVVDGLLVARGGDGR